EELMDERRIVAGVLRAVADLLARLPLSDLEDLASGKSTLLTARRSGEMGTRLSARSDIQSDKRRPSPGRDLRPIVVELRGLASREAGFGLLADLRLTKRELETLARLIDLPVVREDDAEQLRQKIIEGSIGARLNSQAIRGE